MLGKTNTGGGGGGLNFAVKAYASESTLPATAKENTIAVITETAIASWIVDVKEPENPAAGMVWIEVGTESEVAFNLMKKNAIYIYPASVKQYAGSTWADVDAFIYQGGSWAQFSQIVTDVYLFNNGDTCDAVTGGWGAVDGGAVSDSALGISVYYSAKGAQVYTKAGVDLTKFNTLRVLSGTYHTSTVFGIMSKAPSGASGSYNTNNGQCSARGTISAANKEFTLDISQYSGPHYIWIGNSGGGAARQYGCFVAEVQLMK